MIRTFRYAALAVGLVGCAALAADPVPADPLPEGAKVRLGSLRLRRTMYGYGDSMLPPAYNEFVVSGPGGLQTMAVADGSVGEKLGGENNRQGQLVAFSPDGSRALSTNFNGATIWNTKTGETVGKLKIGNGFPTAVGAPPLSADGKFLAYGQTAAYDKKDAKIAVTVWDVDANKEIAKLPAAQNRQVIATLSGDGKTVASWGAHDDGKTDRKEPDPNDPGRRVQLWDVAKKAEKCKIQLPPGYESVVAALSPDGGLIALASQGSVGIYDTATGKKQFDLFGRNGQGRGIAFSPDGKTVAAVAFDGSIQTWNPTTGKLLTTTDFPVADEGAVQVTSLGFSGNDRVIAWGSLGQVRAAWESPSGKLLTPLYGNTLPVNAIGFADGGKEIFTAVDPRQIHRWNAADGKPLPPFAAGIRKTMYGSNIVISADGTRAGAAGNGWNVLDLRTGKEIFALPLRSYRGGPSFHPSPDGSLVAAVFSEYGEKPKPSTGVAYDTVTSRVLGDVVLPPVQFGAHAAVAPDGSKFVLAVTRESAKSKEKRELAVTAWDLKSKAQLAEYVIPDVGYGQTYLTAAPDNKSVLLGTPEGKLEIVDASTGKSGAPVETGKDRITCRPAFDRDGKRFAVGIGAQYGTGGGSAKVFEWPSGKLLHEFKGHRGMVSAVAFSPDGKSLVTGSTDTTALVWPLDK